MSLAYFAASIEDDSNITLPNNTNSGENILNQKRHKLTQRKYPKIENFNTNKVNSVLGQLHNNDNEDDDNNDNFNPPPKPESSGVNKTIPSSANNQTSANNQPSANNNNINEQFSGMPNYLGKTLGKAPIPNYEGTDNLDLNDYSNYGNNKTNEDYYKSVLPGYTPTKNHVNRPYYNNGAANAQHNDYPTQDNLIQKLNYMITLLEEQQDTKTNNVTEEVILYSFLGIFIIFMADTFVRAGKYTR